MAGIPENILFLNLPAHRRVKFNELPESADRSGVLYFVTDADDLPAGIALSGDDLQVRFYSIMQSGPPTNNPNATRDPGPEDFIGYSVGSMWFNGSTGMFWICESMTETSALWMPIKGSLSVETEALASNITNLLGDVLGVGTGELLDEVLGV